MEELNNIKSGETICYFQGLTGTAPSSLMYQVSEMQEAGKLVLTQKKMTNGDLNIYQYLATGV